MTAGERQGETFRREYRLRRRSDFEALGRSGKSRAHPFLVLLTAPNSLPYSRFGFVVSRRVAGKAVARNRVRRRLREAVRRTVVWPGWDVLFIARAPAVDASFGTLRQVVGDLERRAGLLDARAAGKAGQQG